MESRITDLFERLITSNYTYIPFRRKEDYYSMYYSNKSLHKMLKADKNTNYITSNRLFIFNNYKTYSTYGQQTFEFPNEVYQKIIDLTYIYKDNNEQQNKYNDRLFLNITNPSTFSKFFKHI